jgi:hypothetical protein
LIQSTNGKGSVVCVNLTHQSAEIGDAAELVFNGDTSVRITPEAKKRFENLGIK